MSATTEAREGDLLKAAETASLLGCSLRTVHRMAADGRLPYVTKFPGPNGFYLFSRQVVELIAAQAEKKAS